MKTSGATLFSILFFSAAVHAQRINATDENENLGGGINPAVSVIVYETDESTVQKEWKSLMKKGDAKVSNLHGESFAHNALLKDISADKLDIFSKTKKEDNGIKLIVVMKSGGQFLSPPKNSGELSRMKRMLEDFARKRTKESIMEQSRLAEKVYDKDVRKQQDLVRENEDLHRDIERYKDKIQNAEADIKKNLQSQEDAKKKIELQKKVVEAIKEKAIKVE